MNRIRSIVISAPVRLGGSILTCPNETSKRGEPSRTESTRRQTAGPSLTRLDPMFEKPQKAQVVRIKIEAISLDSTSMAPSPYGPLLGESSQIKLHAPQVVLA